MLKHSGSLSCSLENNLSCDCPGGYRGNITCSLAYKGYQLPVYRCLWSFATLITQDARPKINVARLTMIVKMGQGACSLHFCLDRQPIQWLYITMTNSQRYYLTYRMKNCWRFFDAYFQDWAGSVSLSSCPIKAASTVVMCKYDQVTLQLPQLQYQILLTLRWHSLLVDSSDVVHGGCDLQGGQYFQLALQRPSLWSIPWLTKPKIVDALLTFILKFRKGAFHFPFCLWRKPISDLWISVTNPHAD